MANVRKIRRWPFLGPTGFPCHSKNLSWIIQPYRDPRLCKSWVIDRRAGRDSVSTATTSVASELRAERFLRSAPVSRLGPVPGQALPCAWTGFALCLNRLCPVPGQAFGDSPRASRSLGHRRSGGGGWGRPWVDGLDLFSGEGSPILWVSRGIFRFRGRRGNGCSCSALVLFGFFALYISWPVRRLGNPGFCVKMFVFVDRGLKVDLGSCMTFWIRVRLIWVRFVTFERFSNEAL